MRSNIRILLSTCLLSTPIYILYKDLKVPTSGFPLIVKCVQLTHLSLFLAIIYYILILIHDLRTHKNPLKQTIVPNPTEIFYQLALTSTILAGLVYWIMYSLDPKLVTTDYTVKAKPKWLDIALHGGTALILYMDNIPHLHMWRQRVRVDILTMSLFAMLNLGLQKVYSYIYMEEVYGFQERMGVVGRGGLYLGIVGVGGVVGVVCRRVTGGVSGWREGKVLRVRQSVDYSVEGEVIDAYAQ